MSKLILPNVLARPYVVLGPRNAMTAPTGFEAERLQNGEPSDTARVPTVDPIYAGWLFDMQAAPLDFDSFALANVNLSGHGLWRLTSPQQVAELLLPNSFPASTNITGTPGFIANPVSFPDGKYVEPTNPALPWTFTANFPAPVVTARQGTGMACIALRIEAFGSSILSYPRVEVEILDGITTIHMGYRAASKNAIDPGFIFLWPFDPATLSNPNLMGLTVRVTGQPGDNGSYCAAESLNVYYEDAAAVYALDTGWMPTPFDTFGGGDIDGTHPTKSIFYFHGSKVSNLTVLDFQTMDDQAQIDLYPATVYGLPNAIAVLPTVTEPDGYLEAGCVSGGLTLNAANSPGDLVGLIRGSGEPVSAPLVTSASGTTQAGQSYAVDAFTRRSTPSVTLYMKRSVGQQMMTALWKRGEAAPFFGALEPDLSAGNQLFSAYWMTARNFKMAPMQGQERQHADASGDIVMVSFEAEEKL